MRALIRNTFTVGRTANRKYRPRAIGSGSQGSSVLRQSFKIKFNESTPELISNLIFVSQIILTNKSKLNCILIDLAKGYLLLCTCKLLIKPRVVLCTFCLEMKDYVKLIYSLILFFFFKERNICSFILVRKLLIKPRVVFKFCPEMGDCNINWFEKFVVTVKNFQVRKRFVQRMYSTT